MKVSNNNFISHNGNKFVESLNEVSYLYGELVCRDMDKIGMRYSYRHILKPLMENKTLTQLELVNLTGQKAPTVSITLRNMENDGIVRREKNSTDRRETHVCITDKGKKMYKKVLNSLEKADKTILSGISEGELEALAGVLEKMKANLEGAVK
ncbi:MAG: winged helix-turn-helix transcriptional regulator [Oscillospiraceae bacterium]|nr:winged helix-turn-helix transcriptional regulator [Oscillospiraceae bacterium]